MVYTPATYYTLTVGQGWIDAWYEQRELAQLRKYWTRHTAHISAAIREHIDRETQRKRAARERQIAAKIAAPAAPQTTHRTRQVVTA